MFDDKAPAAATAEALPSAKQPVEYGAPQDAKEQARIRPGLRDEELTQAGIRHIEAGEAERLCGLRESGLWVPYPNADGYGRLRLNQPKGGKKYHQQAGSTVHVFIPPGAQRPAPGDDIVLVEGEFKALALTSAGIPAIGQSGFFGFARGERLVPELQSYIDHARPRRILLAGDSDTALNPQFSHAAVKLADLVDIPVWLPRLPIDGPKAWDDLREELQLDDEKLRQRWQEAAEEAVEVDAGMHPGELAVELLRLEQGRLQAGADAGLGKRRVRRRLVEIGLLAKRAGGMNFDNCAKLVEQTGLAGRRPFQNDVKSLEEEKRTAAQEREASNPEFNEEAAAKIVARFAFDGSTYFERNGDRYHSIQRREDMLLRLYELGAPKSRPDGEPVSPAERVLLRIQRERRVVYAGPLGGRTAGVYDEEGKLVIATDSPAFLEGSGKKEPGPMLELVVDLFQEDETQLTVFLGWLQRARAALRHPDQHLPGQAIVLVGPPDCGKTFLQTLITQCLGGREEDASSILEGTQARFTSHLFRAEHLVASDPGMARTPDAQRSFREQLKKLVANERVSCEGKFKDPLTLRPIWRISVSANDDPDSVGILPSPIEDPSFRDKVIFFYCRRPAMLPNNDATEQERHRFRQSLLDDLPNFLTFVDEFEVPSNHRKARFGVREYVHPTVAGLLEAGDRDAPIVEVIGSYLAQQARFRGTAAELLEALQQHSSGRINEHCRTAKHLSYVLQRMAGKNRWQGHVRWSRGVSRHRNPVFIFEVDYET